MKTYAETKDEPPFDWNAALANPPAHGSPYHHYLITLASLWTTCACGNQCDLIPRSKDGIPEDWWLAHLGRRFARHVGYAQWDDAVEVLHEIELRSIQVLEQLRTRPS